SAASLILNSVSLLPTSSVPTNYPLEAMCSSFKTGKTRTREKYRVVYTDHQRLELEKEFHYNRYITIRRKSELAANLRLSERQVKIWFQNRRAKERKLMKKKMTHFDGSNLGSMQTLCASPLGKEYIPSPSISTQVPGASLTFIDSTGGS
uniref:Homeobox domain-containing protein n=1 Tax=Cairina moschata TaxID=8855 RepID=A0A8C3GJ57_CAIMO